jgi:surface carbohydrate biosynthesis protein
MKRLELSPRRWILSPIAIKARDLDGNALLAFAAAERGYGVLLGNAKLKDKPYTPRGFVILKHLHPGKGVQEVSKARAGGHIIGAWCDEGLIYGDAESYSRLKFDRQAYEKLDVYFAWGKHQADDLIKKLGCSPGKMHITGNPRFDVHRPDLRSLFSERTAKIRGEHGRYILVNTRFSLFNYFGGPELNLFRKRARGKLKTAEHEVEARRLINFQGSVFAAFMELIEHLSRHFPNHTVVVRPHPSENHEPWRAKAATLPNVKVVYEGNVIAWILASEICIHTNCTTGVEAYLLGKPAIAYRPTTDGRFDFFLPNALSSEAFDLEQALEMIAAVLNAEATPLKEVAASLETARHFIANIDGKWACDGILDVLDRTDLPEVPLSFGTSWFETAKAGAWGYLRQAKQNSLPREATTEERFARQKFDGLRWREVVEFLESAQRVSGRFNNVQIVQIEDDVVCIH